MKKNIVEKIMVTIQAEKAALIVGKDFDEMGIVLTPMEEKRFKYLERLEEKVLAMIAGKDFDEMGPVLSQKEEKELEEILYALNKGKTVMQAVTNTYGRIDCENVDELELDMVVKEAEKKYNISYLQNKLYELVKADTEGSVYYEGKEVCKTVRFSDGRLMFVFAEIKGYASEAYQFIDEWDQKWSCEEAAKKIEELYRTHKKYMALMSMKEITQG